MRRGNGEGKGGALVVQIWSLKLLSRCGRRDTEHSQTALVCFPPHVEHYHTGPAAPRFSGTSRVSFARVMTATNRRIKALSLEDIDSLTARHLAVEARLRGLAASKENAAESPEWESELKTINATEAKLKEEAEELAAAKALAIADAKKRARVAAAANVELRPAGDVVDAALASWEARTNAVLAPMSASIDTALKIITHALKLASDQGYCEIKIRSTPLTGQARQDNHTFQQTKQLPAVLSMMARVDFVVDLGFAWVPVGASLTREDAKGFWIHHRAISGHPAEMDMDAFVALCDGFDGEVMHSWTLAGEALESDLGRMFLRWRLRRAGYVSRAHTTLATTLYHLHQRNHERVHLRGRLPDAPGAAKPVSADGKKPTSLIEFRTTEFKRTHPEPGEPWLVVACGAAGRRLAGQLRGAEETFEEIEGPTGEERGTTGASFAAYVEATAESASNFNCDAFPTTFGAILAVMPEVIRAAGRINANALRAREEAFRAERVAAAAETAGAE